MARSKRCDGLVRRLRGFALGNFEPVWRVVERIEPLARFVNEAIIDTAVGASRTRPHPLSTVSDYTSWLSLTDKTWFARQLPPDPPKGADKPVEEVVALFERPPSGGVPCPKSTLLFPVFAQYLTDGFLRTQMDDRAKTTSNHEIDLSPLYGRTAAQTDVLRLKSEETGRRGRLKTQVIEDEEYPPYLYEDDGRTIRAEFLDGAGNLVLDRPLGDSIYAGKGGGAVRQIFAVGGDRANATPFVAAMNTLLLREHNRIAGILEEQNAGWNDERVFQTARNIVIVLYIKLVIEEYINHISSACFRLRADPRVVWKAPWNRPNWMTVEFSLLYRWHQLIPDTILWTGGAPVQASQMLLDNRYLTSVGLESAFRMTSDTGAMRIGLWNTAAFLTRIEQFSVQQGRDMRVPGYNAYREAMGMPAAYDFQHVTGDEARQQALRDLYGHPDHMEFYAGLFAEDVSPNTPMPPLIGAMVALDAFSQALTNPLLSQHVWNERTFTEWGMKEIARTSTVADLVLRNTSGGPNRPAAGITMTRPDWKRVFVGL